MIGRAGERLCLLACGLILSIGAALGAAGVHAQADGTAEAKQTSRLIELGPGDTVSLQVYGQPDMASSIYVSDDGTLPVPLVGSVPVAGLSPSEASTRIERALKDGGFLVDPHVTLTVVMSRSQRVSVLGQVGAPGRYPVESTTSIFDLLAQAGGVLTETSSDLIYIIRPEKDGTTTRYPVDLKALADGKTTLPVRGLRGGDTVMVPRAEQFYINGEVMAPNKYRLESGMTVFQAIARAGGVTPRGSDSRVEIKRKEADGSYKTLKAKLSDPVKADDVIRVKESIF
jgi:polysaccharide export outer membrane protein